MSFSRVLTDDILENDQAPDEARSLRRVFVRDMVLDARIGVYAHEKNGRQRVRINADMWVEDTPAAVNDDISNVVSYELVADGVKDIIETGHINLVETLAEEIAALCLSDPRVLKTQIRVEKLDVYENAVVGVEISRRQDPASDDPNIVRLRRD